MARTILFSNDWLVFIDGVQVPWQSLSFVSQLNQPAGGSIALEPDHLLALVRPRSVVAVFCRDRFGDRTYADQMSEVLDGYHYYCGGDVVAWNDDKSSSSRIVRLDFATDLELLASHRVLTNGAVGSDFFTGLVAGSTFIFPIDYPNTAGPTDLLSVALLAKSLARPSGTAVQSGVYRSRGSADDDFGLRTASLLSWMSGCNASLRVQAVRTRLVNKLCGVEDGTLTRLAEYAVSSPLLQQVAARVDATDSFLSMTLKLMDRFGYRIATVPAPYFPPRELQPPGGAPEIVEVPSDLAAQTPQAQRLRRDWYRNDYLCLPNLMHSAPPPCNLIFPDMVGQHGVARNFLSEPTRSMFVDPGIAGGRLVFVEAPGLLPSDVNQMKTPAEFWANFLQLFRPTAQQTTSAWESASEGGLVNTLDALSDDELERGLVLRVQDLEPEYGLALMRTFEFRRADGQLNREGFERVRGALDGASEQEADALYLRYVQEWLQYKHQLARMRRGGTVHLKGHRWLVPGFSCVVLDADVSYLAYVASVQQSVQPNGVETTNVELEHVRPITTAPTALLKEVRATLNRTGELRQQSADGLRAGYAADEAALRRKLADLRVLRDRVQAGERAAIPPFEQQYRALYERVRQTANVVVGPRRDPAGAATLVVHPELGTELLPYLASPAAAPATAPADAYRSVELGVATIGRFNSVQAAQAEVGQPAHAQAAEAVAAVNASQALLAGAEADLQRTLHRLHRLQDFPIPPSFYNPDFIQLATLDRLYQDLLGCRPFYTGPYAANLRTDEQPADFVGPLAADQLRASAYTEHVKLLRLLARVFPPLLQSVAEEDLAAVQLDPAPGSAVTSWSEVVDREGDGPGTFEWQHRAFLRRSAQTLREYLRTHGFSAELETIASDEPAPFVFYRMRPLPSPGAPPGVTVGAKTYGWDDSVLCRLVDENTRTADEAEEPLTEADLQAAVGEQLADIFADTAGVVNRQIMTTATAKAAGFSAAEIEALGLTDYDGYAVVTAKADPTTPTGVSVRADKLRTPETVRKPRGPDPHLRARRAKTDNPVLTSGFRQDLWTAFARRHFGGRALAGD